MRALASYIMRGRLQSVLCLTSFIVFSLIIPPLTYISGAVLGLVVLRRGVNEGGWVLFIGALLMAVIAFVSLGKPSVAFIYTFVVWLPVLLLATVLRQSISLDKTFIVAAAIGGLVVVAIYLTISDPVQWWSERVLTPVSEMLFGQAELSPEQQQSVQQAIAVTAKLMSGLLAAALILSAIFSLLIARWWQALLYNPGGFRVEFVALKMGKSVALAALLLLLSGYVFDNVIGRLAVDLAIVLLTLFVIQGVALLHDIASRYEAHRGWLIAFYILLFFALPHVVATLILIALLDSWISIRRFLPPIKQGST